MTTPRSGPAASSTQPVAEAALAVFDVDKRGLDRLDRAVLTALVSSFGGGPVGLSTLAVAVGEEAETVEEVVEPYLLRAGLLARTSRGRVATPAAFEHLGIEPPPPGSATRSGRRLQLPAAQCAANGRLCSVEFGSQGPATCRRTCLDSARDFSSGARSRVEEQ